MELFLNAACSENIGYMKDKEKIISSSCLCSVFLFLLHQKPEYFLSVQSSILETRTYLWCNSEPDMSFSFFQVSEWKDIGTVRSLDLYLI